ncbi:MAG: PHP domain-containing protein [Gammaproteobacteria bacterium]|nr:PHP domain-containing protein [Gammaproteobacteria bacterium]
MKVDLHTHSHFSDGAHSPKFVVERAHANGVSHLALTDHDCLEGYVSAANLDLPDSLQLIPGVEISALWDTREVHVVGLFVCPSHPGLSSLLIDQQERRWQRFMEFDRKLVKAGISGLDQYLEDSPCCSPGRAHVARFLADNTRLGTHKKAFRSLTRNGRFYVRPQWCPLDDAIQQIRAAGGIAVLAHPHRYPLSKSGFKRLLREFRDAGGEAMEVCCSNMPRDKIAHLAQLSQELELLASAGSDFHSSEATWMDIGRLPPVPETVTKNAIWTHARWHFPDAQPD